MQRRPNTRLIIIASAALWVLIATTATPFSFAGQSRAVTSNSCQGPTNDVIVMALRFRDWPDETMKHFVDAYQRGVPEAQTITYIPGYWQDGVTAPARPRRTAAWL